MRSVEDLREVTDRVFEKVEATPEMWYSIRNAARCRPTLWERILPVLKRPAFGAAVLAAVLLCVGLLTFLPTASPQLVTTSAGGKLGPGEMPGDDLPTGSIGVGMGRPKSTESLFQDEHAILIVGSAAYRLLAEPAELGNHYRGKSLGKVTEYNIEPAIGDGEITSDAVMLGETVYAVKGCEGALAAANVEGKLRLFQRVSFSGRVLGTGEGLRQTLCAPEDVASVTLRGVTVSDGAAVKKLMNALYEGDYLSAGFQGKGDLQILLRNGLTLQLLTKDENVSACGTWSCPDFFEAWATVTAQ